MNWRCLIRGHKWVFGEQMFHLRHSWPSGVRIGSYPQFRDRDVLLKTRCCSRCYKKVREGVGANGWVTCGLSKEELRAKRLKDLGI